MEGLINNYSPGRSKVCVGSVKTTVTKKLLATRPDLLEEMRKEEKAEQDKKQPLLPFNVQSQSITPEGEAICRTT